MALYRTTLGGVLATFALVSAAGATTVLYTQDFENPANFVNDGGDVNISTTVNGNYGNQPPGFTFAQDFTVETLLITGNQAFGTGYSDPAGTGGNFAVGMLSDVQNDRLGLSFNVGTNDFMNVGIDISSIDLSVFGGPFVAPGSVPIFRFTLYDNPGGGTVVATGTVLDFVDASGTASPQSVFDWTNLIVPLDATGSTNGNVVLGIDLLQGGYGSIDNIVIAASDTPGDIGDDNGDDDNGAVPVPATLALLGLGLIALRARRIG